MNKKAFLVLGVVLAVIVGIALLQSIQQSKPTNESSGLIVSQNAIYIADQTPGQIISVAVARLEKSGFVVIHEDNAGQPGKILGTSGLLAAGENKNLPPISLSRLIKDGETLYAMIHIDDGDGAFDVAKDKPALDSVSGEPVMMIFVVSKDATEPGAVSL